MSPASPPTSQKSRAAKSTAVSASSTPPRKERASETPAPNPARAPSRNGRASGGPAPTPSRKERASGARADVLSRRALNRATLARQLLLRREKMKPAAAIERLLCLQAQLARPPFVALWSRLAGFGRDDLIAPIEKRDLVRATMMRATIHLMTRRDYVAFRPALQPALTGSAQAILKDKIKAFDIEKLVTAARVFFGEKPSNFVELRDHMLGRFPTLNERAMGYVVRMQLPLVQVPERGALWAYPSQANFASAEWWLDEPLKTIDTPHALALRYFAAFGPASVQDFQNWTGFGAMRAVIEELRPRLRAFRDERGRELFDLPKAPRPLEDEEAPVRFLPEFDNVLLGYGDRSRIIGDEHKGALATKNLFVPATFLVDGFIAGLWTVEAKKSVARLIVKPLIALTKPARAALTEEAERLVRFIEPDAKTHAVDLAREGRG